MLSRYRGHWPLIYYFKELWILDSQTKYYGNTITFVGVVIICLAWLYDFTPFCATVKFAEICKVWQNLPVEVRWNLLKSHKVCWNLLKSAGISEATRSAKSPKSTKVPVLCQNPCSLSKSTRFAEIFKVCWNIQSPAKTMHWWHSVTPGNCVAH